MVLQHVTQRTGLVVVAGTFFNTQFFTQRYLDVVDVAVVPQRFDNRVAKTQGLNVLNHFLTQIVVNPEDLVFVERL